MKFLPLLVLFVSSSLALAGDPSRSAVKVTVTHAGDRPGWATIDSGSGTVLEGGPDFSYVLTNWHVVPEARGRIEIHLAGKTYPADFLAIDDTCDLALLTVKANLPCVKLADQEPPVGSTLRQFGFPNGQYRPKSGPAIGYQPGEHVRYQLVSGRWIDGGPVYYAGFAPEQGDSGSGLFDESGNLVAVNWGGTHRECCVALPDIKRFLNTRASKNYPAPFVPTVVPQNTRPAFGIPGTSYPAPYCPPGRP